jgi:hypothetical protein
MTAKIDELLAMSDLKTEWGKRRDVMLNDKIDITGFLVRLIEDYPQSINELKKNPDFNSFLINHNG